MNVRHLLSTVAFCLSVQLATPAITRAETISVLAAFSASNVDALSVTPFDPALGTLDSIDINITGRLDVTGSLPSLGFAGIGGIWTAIPNDFRIEVEQQFFGLGGRYFEFSDPATFRFDGHSVSTGPGVAAFFLTADYEYSFQFNAITDLVGGFALFTPTLSNLSMTGPPIPTATSGVLIPPLTGALAQRSDFVDNGFPLNEIDLVQSATAQGTAPPIISSLHTVGLLEIRYNYTPTAPVPEPVPEPATLVLTSAGLALTAAMRRRRKAGCSRAA